MDRPPAVAPLRRYRASGADLPFGDPRKGHGVAMEGYFWRFSDARTGRVLIALCGIHRDAGAGAGAWANVALAAHPGAAIAPEPDGAGADDHRGGWVREATLAPAGDDPRRLGPWAGAGGRVFSAAPGRLRADLGADARIDARLHDVRGWTRRPLGGVGAAHLLPGLSQYWHPHVLGGRASGTATIGEETIDLAGFDVYAEKNWGRDGFPDEWWWGQAQGFADAEVCVAFAGGDVAVGPATLRATALVVRLGETIVRLGGPVLSPVRADVGDEHWHLRGRSARWSVELEGAASMGSAHVLPVPLCGERGTVPASLQHLAGRVRLVVRRRGRVLFAGESALAGLEHGGRERVAAELARRRLA